MKEKWSSFEFEQRRVWPKKTRWGMQLDALWLAHSGEVNLSEKEYSHLKAVTPSLPQTPWRAAKIKATLWLRSRK